MASPRDLTGVLRWWSADAPSTVVDGRVTEAPDVVAGSVATRFGQGRVGPEVISLDGRPAWRFGGSASPASLLTPDVPAINGAGYSWVFVLAATAGYAGQIIAPGPNSGVTASSSQVLAESTGSFRWTAFAGTSVSLPMPSGEHLLVVDHDGGSGATRIYTSGQSSARATLQRRSLAGQQHIGRHGSNERPLAADVRGILLIDHALTDAEIANTLEPWRAEGARSTTSPVIYSFSPRLAARGAATTTSSSRRTTTPRAAATGAASSVTSSRRTLQQVLAARGAAAATTTSTRSTSAPAAALGSSSAQTTASSGVAALAGARGGASSTSTTRRSQAARAAADARADVATSPSRDVEVSTGASGAVRASTGAVASVAETFVVVAEVTAQTTTRRLLAARSRATGSAFLDVTAVRHAALRAASRAGVRAQTAAQVAVGALVVALGRVTALVAALRGLDGDVIVRAHLIEEPGAVASLLEEPGAAATLVEEPAVRATLLEE